MSKRLKSKPIPSWAIPKNFLGANQSIAAIGGLSRDLKMLEAEMNEQLAKIKERYEEASALPRETMALQLKGLEIWCEAHRAELLVGEAKSARLGAGIIGWRTRPSRVVLKEVERVIEWLTKAAMEKFLRRKVEVDKEAMLKEPSEAEKIPGVEIKKGEEFYVEPFEARLSEATSQ